MIKVWKLGDFVHKIAKDTYNLINPTIFNLTTADGTMYECGEDVDEDEDQREMYKANCDTDLNAFVNEDNELVLEDLNQEFKLNLVVRISNMN